MKKQLFFLLLAAYVSQGCSNYIKVNRTVTKTITLTFNIDNTGAFNSISTISASDITNLFDPDIFANHDSRIDKFDLNSINIQGIIDTQRNTATQVTVKAEVTTGTPKALLNDTKLIRIGGNQLLQDAKDILNVATGEISKEISFENALASLQAVGVAELQKIISENLQGVNSKPLSIKLSGSSLTGQRLVGTITVTMNASITYYRCEKWTDFMPLGVDEC
ncbi:MAG: hypothetical protein U0Y10_07680 [Spirosomataceae bacterium]